MSNTANVTLTEPIRSKVARRSRRPAVTGIAAVTEPVRMTCPASSSAPRAPSVFASHTAR